MRTLLVEMLRPTPKTGLFCLTVFACVVWVPSLASIALTGRIISSIMPLLSTGLLTFVVSKPEENALFEDPFLSFLIFKTYYNFPGLGFDGFV